MTSSWDGIEERLAGVTTAPVVDEQSARSALADLMSTVSQINQSATSDTPATDAMGERDLIGGLADRLKNWIDRLIDKLTEIVEKIGKATSFTITVGTGLSVSVNFGPFTG